MLKKKLENDNNSITNKQENKRLGKKLTRFRKKSNQIFISCLTKKNQIQMDKRSKGKK